MVPAAASPARAAVHHNVTCYDCGPALPNDDEPFLGQHSQGMLQRRDPHAL